MTDLFNSAYMLNKCINLLLVNIRNKIGEKTNGRQDTRCMQGRLSKLGNQPSQQLASLDFFFVLEFYLFLISNEYHIFNILVYNN